jgi:hypothetical protein
MRARYDDVMRTQWNGQPEVTTPGYNGGHKQVTGQPSSPYNGYRNTQNNRLGTIGMPLGGNPGYPSVSGGKGHG